jgi:hypothetical protein
MDGFGSCPALYIESASMNNTLDGRFDFNMDITPTTGDARARISCTPDKYHHAVTAAIHVLALIANGDNLDGLGKGLLNEIDPKIAQGLAKQFLSTVDKKYLSGFEREDTECDTVYNYMY